VRSHPTTPTEVELSGRVVHARHPREELREVAANDLEERPTMHRVKGVPHVNCGIDPVRMDLQVRVDRVHQRVEARGAGHAKLAREWTCSNAGCSASGREGIWRE
tara:strand:+ start:1982 stop:2296 length:315 start_codon:yes stop_codon:yes gene_type:complete